MKVKVHLKFLYSLLSAIILATPAIVTNAKGAPIASRGEFGVRGNSGSE